MSPSHVPSTVLDTLIDARLLTSYEVSANGDERAELTTASRSSTSPCSATGHGWCAGRCRMPRERSSAMSSEIRRIFGMSTVALKITSGQARRTWSFLAWRQRYPGGLTATEEAFGETMTRYAEGASGGDELRLAAPLVVLLTVLGIIA